MIKESSNDNDSNLGENNQSTGGGSAAAEGSDSQKAKKVT